MMPQLAVWQWLLAAVCAFLTGISKTGVPGLGILVVPLMVLAVGDARLSAGWLLPLLCAADVVALMYWRRHAAAGRLFSLAPWVLAGMAVGAATLTIHEAILRRIVGGTIFIMLAVYLYRRWRPYAGARAHSWAYGTMAGFSTTVANAAGPVMNLYLLSKRLPKEEFIATGAWFFFAINLAKVPIYVLHEMIGPKSLVFDALLLTPLLIGTVTGRWLVQHISARLFEQIVLLLAAVSTVLLFV